MKPNPFVLNRGGRKYLVFSLPTGHEYDPRMPVTPREADELIEHLRAKNWVTVEMLERTKRLVFEYLSAEATK